MKYGEMLLCRHPGDSEQSGRGLMRPVRTSVRNILIHGSGLESDRLWSGSTASSQSNLADQIRPAATSCVQLCGTIWWWRTWGNAAGVKKHRWQIMRWWRKKDARYNQNMTTGTNRLWTLLLSLIFCCCFIDNLLSLADSRRQFIKEYWFHLCVILY